MRFAAHLLGIASLIPLASAFAFTFKDANETLAQCGSVEVIWQGGQPPFELLIIVSPTVGVVVLEGRFRRATLCAGRWCRVKCHPTR
jgi:hypothetical protein